MSLLPRLPLGPMHAATYLSANKQMWGALDKFAYELFVLLFALYNYLFCWSKPNGTNGIHLFRHLAICFRRAKKQIIK